MAYPIVSAFKESHDLEYSNFRIGACGAFSKEINDARRLYTKHDWAVINVSRKSIEETAATIIKMYQEHHETLL